MKNVFVQVMDTVIEFIANIGIIGIFLAMIGVGGGICLFLSNYGNSICGG